MKTNTRSTKLANITRMSIPETRLARKKNRSRRDVNIPIFISTHPHNNMYRHHHRSGIGGIDNNRNSNCTTININDNKNNNSIINSIDHIRSHILNNPHFHSHYHPHFHHHHHHHHQHHQHHRRHLVCECGVALPPSPRSRPARYRQNAPSSPPELPEDLSSPRKSGPDLSTYSPSDVQSPWKDRHK
ncbi:hypothetical protein RRG08_035900 [Elysia crispata]|uniref:Uncharacterized protein n=1 Tax=Elysia crispata TaxID=231223 RepID=A0AAE1DR77_9GAST|nr:hypothetical protein RRG08_035900 [Elysia crispata]